jgi:hypothetical protein
MFKSLANMVIVAMVAALFGAQANAQLTNVSSVYSKVDASVVLSVLGEMDFQTSLALVDGISVVTASKGSTAPLLLTIVPCPGLGMPNCHVLVMMKFAPDSILAGATVEMQLATLAAINAYDAFLTVKFIIKEPGYVTALRTEFYPFGGTRGNVAMSISAMSDISSLALNTMASMSGLTAGFSGTLGAPITDSKVSAYTAVGAGASLVMPVTTADIKLGPQAVATRKALDLIGTLVKSKTFRENLFYSE